MADQTCAERHRLTQAIIKAVQNVHAVTAGYRLALRTNQDTTSDALALEKARAADLEALAALEQHRKEHGC